MESDVIDGNATPMDSTCLASVLVDGGVIDVITPGIATLSCVCHGLKRLACESLDEEYSEPVDDAGVLHLEVSASSIDISCGWMVPVKGCTILMLASKRIAGNGGQSGETGSR